MPRPTAVYFDTIVLSNFARAQCQHLLAGRYAGRLFISPQVYDALPAGQRSGYDHVASMLHMVDEGVIQMASLAAAELVHHRELLRTLGAGEASVLTLAKVRGGMVATDDRAARQACSRLKIMVTGTIGILAACVRDGQISGADADTALHAMIAGGFFSPVRCIADAF